MSISDDIKLIKDLERHLKSMKNFLDTNYREESIFCQEMKKNYTELAEYLGRKYQVLFEKTRIK